jgi:hypothetical protein
MDGRAAGSRLNWSLCGDRANDNRPRAGSHAFLEPRIEIRPRNGGAVAAAVTVVAAVSDCRHQRVEQCTAFRLELAADATKIPEHFEVSADLTARYMRAIVMQPLFVEWTAERARWRLAKP